MESKQDSHKTHILCIDVFLYFGYNGSKCNAGKNEYYGVKWGGKGDIIECELNLETMEVSYIVNDKNQGITYILNKNKTYHFVFSFRCQNDSFSVISETMQNEKNQIIIPSFVFFCFFIFCLLF